MIEIGSKTAEKNSAQTNRQTDKLTDTTKIMVMHLAVNKKCERPIAKIRSTAATHDCKRLRTSSSPSVVLDVYT